MSERIIDACCLINLYATGTEDSIFRACGGFWLPAQVQNEALRIRRFDEDTPTRLVSQNIDLGDAIAAGLIQTCQLEGQDEVGGFVRFAMELDDGEASCLAIAMSRGWTVATDDRKARRMASENGIALTSTPELIQRWVDAASPSEATVADVLKKIELFAKFRPRRNDPLHGWWTGLTEKT
jgi:predicted nucleic acid-binding protein